MLFVSRAVWRTAAIALFSLSAGLAPLPALSQTPEWFTFPDSSAFKLRRDAEADALNARAHQPSAGAATYADLAAHARLSVMSSTCDAHQQAILQSERSSPLAGTIRPIVNGQTEANFNDCY